MRYAVTYILVLAICEPLITHAKKVVLVLPRQIRRSPAITWRQSNVHYKKSPYGGNEHHHRHVYHGSQSQVYPGRKPSLYKSPPIPHGGDDFDQGHEEVNHVHVPYGKDVTHATTYGKPYIPYENIKGTFAFRPHERYPSISPQKYMESHKYADTPKYSESEKYVESGYPQAPSRYAATASEDYGTSASANYHHEVQPDSYYSDVDGSTPGVDYHERRNDRKKYYTQRSIEKELGLRNHYDTLANLLKEKEPLITKSTEIGVKDVTPHARGIEGAIFLPTGGIPSATVAGSKDGVVLKDSVYLDDYQKQIDEITKTWPSAMLGAAIGGNSALQPNYPQHQPLHTGLQFATAGLPGDSFQGTAGWVSSFAQSKQGYAVKEDLMEPPHDFRTMPLQAASFQGLPLGLKAGAGALTHIVHG